MVIGSAIFGVPIFIILALFCGAVAAFNKGKGGIGEVFKFGCIAVIGLLIIIAFALLSLLGAM